MCVNGRADKRSGSSSGRGGKEREAGPFPQRRTPRVSHGNDAVEGKREGEGGKEEEEAGRRKESQSCLVERKERKGKRGK